MGQAAVVERSSERPSVDAGGSAGRPSTRETVVSVSQLTKRYKRTEALRCLDLDVRRGEIFGLIGPDGAGKSSAIKSIAGVLRYDDGLVEVFGERIDSERTAERVKDRIGLMPQGLGNNLYGELSVEENVDYFGRLRLVARDELEGRKKRLLSVTRLEQFKDRPMKQLSGGMKQKLGLVCTLIHQPRLVLLDEPTTGVDPVSRRDFWAILTELVHEHEISAIVSTAYMDEAAYFHRLALLMNGKIVSQGTEDDILAVAPGSIVTLTPADQIRAIRTLRSTFPQVEALGREVRVFVESADVKEATDKVTKSLAGAQPERLTAGRPDLEDVLVHLLRKEKTAPTPGVTPQTEVQSSTADTEAIERRRNELAINAQQLVRTFGEFRAVDGVSFSVRQGEVFGLLGANGAGKTTVIKMLTGLLRPTRGTGSVAGADVTRARREVKERIGYVSQSFSLYLDMTVSENILFFAGVYGIPRRRSRDRLRWVLETTDLK
ncbi:MAG: ATP-binding cassette domain-containing protein, partial [Pirellulales bacterium]|nr:ATP-binding cassette domain-containing protein [Pirellulales bacterium]